MRLLPLLALIGIGALAPPARALDIAELHRFSQTHPPGSVYMGVRLLGALLVHTDEVDGYGLRQLSALAWDADDSLLYALSDDGYLAHLQPRFENGMLVGLDFLAAHALREADGTPVADDAADSEGIAIANGDNGVAGDAELTVSFEIAPRILRYAPDGRLLGVVDLPADLRDPAAYGGENEMLEGLTRHPDFGLLVAPERPLKAGPQATIPIHDANGPRWQYTPTDPDHSALVSLETAPDGELLVLERRYKNIFSPVWFALRGVRLPADGGTPVPRDIVRFDSGGEFRIDNFEAVAHHEGNRYFLVSDDNRSALQRTVLIYVELLPAP